MALDEREDAGPERESRALRILEAYMMRRKLAGMPTQGASNLAVSVVRALDGKRDTEAAQVIAETLAAQDADSRRWQPRRKWSEEFRRRTCTTCETVPGQS